MKDERVWLNLVCREVGTVVELVCCESSRNGVAYEPVTVMMLNLVCREVGTVPAASGGQCR